jgi:hypothetical protein
MVIASRCSIAATVATARVSRFVNVKSSVELDQPQVRTPDGFVPRRTGHRPAPTFVKSRQWRRKLYLGDSVSDPPSLPLAMRRFS